MSCCSPVHEVLYNTDILSHVFQCFMHDPLPPSAFPNTTANEPDIGDRTLAAAARTCKAFSDPALRILWWSLPELGPLWRILTPLQRLVGPHAEPLGTHEYVLCGEISAENWARFRTYAERIREVRADATSAEVIDRSFWGYLAHYLRGEYLLPRLQSLTWVTAGPYDTHLLTLLSPSLRRLELFLAYRREELMFSEARQSAALDMLMITIRKEAPNLRYLKVFCLQHRAPFLSIGKFTNLRRLDLLNSLEINDLETVKMLAGLPALEELNDVSIMLPDTEHSRALFNVPGFLKLRSLSVCGDVTQLLTFFEAVKPGTLHILKVKAYGFPEDWAESFELLVPKLAAVRTLSLEVSDPSQDPENVWVLEDFLMPLFGLRAVQELHLRTIDDRYKWYITIDVDDADLEIVFKTWPNLTALALEVESETSPTLCKLSRATAHAPALESLILPHMNVNVVDAENEIPTPLPIHHALKRLTVFAPDRLTIPESMSTAALLTKMFPELDPSACAQIPVSERLPGQTSLRGESTRESRVEYIEGAKLWKETVQAIKRTPNVDLTSQPA